MSFAEHLLDRGPCPVCGSTDTTVRMTFNDIPVERCQHCSMSFSAKVLDEAALERYYAEDFGSQRHLDGQKVNADVNLAALHRLLGDRLRLGTRVLDIGTGYGLLLARLRDEFGCEVTGVELSVGEAEYARETVGVDVRPVALAEAGLPTGAFDLVLALEVIEHIPNPLPFLEEATQYVAPGGDLVIGTDNFDSSIVRRLGGAFPKWIPHTHVSHFNHVTLPRALNAVDGLGYADGISYSGWEYYARAAVTGRGDTRDPATRFDLEETLATEMGGKFRFFEVRKRLNRHWFDVAARSDLRGSMMLARATRQAPAT